MAGGFGTGKSHLLGYLAEVARQQRFVVSRIVVSKETPLSHPGHVLAAALRDAALPDRPDDPVAACVTALREQPEALEAMEIASARRMPDSPPLFAACLFLVRRAATPPETLRRIARLWSGAKVSVPAIRQALVDSRGRQDVFAQGGPRRGADGAAYALRAAVVPRGRLRRLVYPARRGRADRPLYAVAACAVLCGARPLARPGGRSTVSPASSTAYAITDDFVTAVINARQDSEKLPERLTLKGRAADAAVALSTIRHIERTVLQNRLLPPTLNDLTACHDKVLRLYSAAYDWPAPPLPPVERTATRTLRQYIKGWITQWDMRRLGGGNVLLIADSIASNYTEDATLAEPHGRDDEEPQY